MAQAASPQLLYRFLGIGLTLVAAVFFGGRMLEPAPAGGDNTVAFALAGVSLILLAFAQLYLRARVPARAPGQTVDAYWATPAIVAQIMRVWFVTEGAGIMAGAGYWVTGHAMTAVAMLLAIGVYWMTGPDVFAKP